MTEFPGDVNTPPTNPPPNAPTPPAPTAVSFQWGGKTFTTRAGWEAYAKAHGINLGNWYANHPTIAHAFGV